MNGLGLRALIWFVAFVACDWLVLDSVNSVDSGNPLRLLVCYFVVFDSQFGLLVFTGFRLLLCLWYDVVVGLVMVCLVGCWFSGFWVGFSELHGGLNLVLSGLDLRIVILRCGLLG